MQPTSNFDRPPNMPPIAALEGESLVRLQAIIARHRGD